jgi:hypothetical protein
MAGDRPPKAPGIKLALISVARRRAILSCPRHQGEHAMVTNQLLDIFAVCAAFMLSAAAVIGAW